eukprot:TRINITY_DN2082_c0_g1_i1.p1 TRINITY_DN2082_c0_g1~~TRINITY_DN2082_c0_g1_i1.p1  ORF type:complete len:406 (-),score=103.64 TRINITY_DN2082_c0_g1_i1:99-1316(-)
MTARAVVDLRNQAPSHVNVEGDKKPSIAIDSDEPPIDVDAVATANKNYSDMEIVRTELRNVLEYETANTNTSLRVLFSAEQLAGTMSQVVERVRVCDADAAKHYLCHPTLFPVRNKPAKKKFVKVQKPLSGHVLHMFTDFRKWVLPTFWEVLGIDEDNIEQNVAMTWLDKDEFMLFDKGQQAIGAAAKTFFRRTGATDHIIKSAGAGGVEHISMTVGQFMLFASFARHELMVAAGLRSRHRKSSADGTYKWWCEEATPAGTIMPKSAAVFNGISIVDFSDPCRFDMVLALAGEPSVSPSGSGAASSFSEAAGRARVAGNRDPGEGAEGSGADVAVDGQAPAAAPASGRVDELDDFGDADLYPPPADAVAGQGDEGAGEEAAIDGDLYGGGGTNEEENGEEGERGG